MEVIKVENLYKQYRLGQVSTGSIAHDLNRWWHTVRGKEDPYEKITGVNNREENGSNDYVWALQDINFSVKQGEVLGIIGRNGAGKSTLLKILSKVTSPTKGNIKVKGRIASLLEVGTGFHPELTGRENIFLNGAILGMTKSEIRSKFDEIVAFSGVEKYIDTPVKRYSSGMYVRLAFAVAAHLEPEILIVDEVLAVGDAEFQKKCLGKMKDVSGEGRTVLFVSHNIAAVKELCTKAIMLKNGELHSQGLVDDLVTEYTINNSFKSEYNFDKVNDPLYINQIFINPTKGNLLTISSGTSFLINFHLNKTNINLAVTIEVSSINDVVIFHHGHWMYENKDATNGDYQLEIKLPPHTLNAGMYKMTLIFAENYHDALLVQKDIEFFEIENEAIARNARILPGVLRPNLEYSVNKI